MRTFQIELRTYSEEKMRGMLIYLPYYAWYVARRQYWALFPLAILASSYGFYRLIKATLQINDMVIRHFSSSRRWGLYWDEIEKIGQGTHDVTVLYAKGKTYVLANFSLFKGKDKAALMELYNRQIESRGIPVVSLTQEETQAVMMPQ